jgi:hypothetical protein
MDANEPDQRTDTDPELLKAAAASMRPEPAQPRDGGGGSEHPPGHHEPPPGDDSEEGAPRRRRSMAGEA